MLRRRRNIPPARRPQFKVGRQGEIARLNFGTTPHPQNLPIAPIFIADSISLAVSREKDRKLRIVYAGWDNANVVQPDGYGQARRGWEADSYPQGKR